MISFTDKEAFDILKDLSRIEGALLLNSQFIDSTQAAETLSAISDDLTTRLLRDKSYDGFKVDKNVANFLSK